MNRSYDWTLRCTKSPRSRKNHTITLNKYTLPSVMYLARMHALKHPYSRVSLEINRRFYNFPKKVK